MLNHKQNKVMWKVLHNIKFDDKRKNIRECWQRQRWFEQQQNHYNFDLQKYIKDLMKIREQLENDNPKINFR